MRLHEWVEHHRDEVMAEPPEVTAIAMDLKVARRELGDAEDVRSPDGRVEHVHSACLALARAALAASGYRLRANSETQHYRVLESLQYTVGLSSSDVEELQGYRRLRHRAVYQQVGVASESTARAALAQTRRLHTQVEAWLASQYPEIRTEES